MGGHEDEYFVLPRLLSTWLHKGFRCHRWFPNLDRTGSQHTYPPPSLPRCLAVSVLPNMVREICFIRCHSQHLARVDYITQQNHIKQPLQAKCLKTNHPFASSLIPQPTHNMEVAMWYQGATHPRGIGPPRHCTNQCHLKWLDTSEVSKDVFTQQKGSGTP